MARTHEKQNAFERAAALVAFAALAAALAACASYEGADTKLHPFGTAEDGGTDFGGASGSGAGVSAGGSSSIAGTGGSATNGGTGASAGVGGTEAATTGGSAGVGGSSPSTGGTAGTGGVSTGGSAGSNAVGGTGGVAGSVGAGGSGGSGAVEQLLSQGKPASADSEETAKGNLAALGNDGSATTRWCAADGAGGHYWQVDLSKSYTLSKLQISWEKAAVYQFKVEGSPDGTTWALILDQTKTTTATADQTYPLAAAPTARWVRITTTTLPNATTWASFFELQVFGH